jgi:catechol 2,3-dioxygenase-like lactoylglutathione lyase family enzyme
MIDHAGISVRDLARSKAFYVAALAPLGYKLLADLVEWHAAGFGDAHPEFWLGLGQPTNGDDDVHVCFSAKSRAEVRAFYDAAIAAGGRDNGPPGLRPMYHADYYGAFVLDPDGNGIEACCRLPE